MENKYDVIYLVLHEDEPVYASEEEDFAEAYISRQREKRRKIYLTEMEVEEDDIKGNWEAEYQLGYDSDEDNLYEIFEMDISRRNVGESIEVKGIEISYNTIYSLLEKGHFEDFY